MNTFPPYSLPSLLPRIVFPCMLLLAVIVCFMLSSSKGTTLFDTILLRILPWVGAVASNIFAFPTFNTAKSFLFHVRWSLRSFTSPENITVRTVNSLGATKIPTTSPFAPVIQRALRWPRDKLARIAEDCLLAILAAGPIPKHLAVIMDGNRRYARKSGVEVREGHAEGANALRKILAICFRLDVKCMTVYAFSIENFNRTPEEVDGLMELIGDFLLSVAQPGDIIDEYAVRLNVFGRKELLSDSTRTIVEKVEKLTQHNTGTILNICSPYTSRDEITTAVEACVQAAIDSGSDVEPNITEHDIDAQLMTSRAGCPPVDILLRTGGDKRLSDFLLWQCCENTQIQFKRRLWPELRSWDLVSILLDYQRKVWNTNING